MTQRIPLKMYLCGLCALCGKFCFLQIHQVWQSLKKNVSAPERFVNRTKPDKTGKGPQGESRESARGKPNAQGQKI